MIIYQKYFPVPSHCSEATARDAANLMDRENQRLYTDAVKQYEQILAGVRGLYGDKSLEYKYILGHPIPKPESQLAKVDLVYGRYRELQAQKDKETAEKQAEIEHLKAQIQTMGQTITALHQNGKKVVNIRDLLEKCENMDDVAKLKLLLAEILSVKLPSGDYIEL